MIIKYTDSGRAETSLKDFLAEWFYIGRYEWDDADYGFTITLFGRSWNWVIYNDKESYFEFQQLEYDREARWMRNEMDYINSLEEDEKC